MSSPQAAPVLATHAVHVDLAGRPVLRGASVALRPGWTAIVGPNGAGKSTLLRTLAGLVKPSGGEVWLDGQALGRWPTLARARRLAWLSQGGPADGQGELQGELTVRDVAHLGRLPHLGLFAAPGPTDEAAVDAALAVTECSDWQHRRLHELSGGERQRALLARVLAGQAGVMLLDEPTAHLDPPHQIALLRLVQAEARRGAVVATVLHDLSLALAADRLVVMAGGRIVAEGERDDPALHDALVNVFEGSIRIVRLESDAMEGVAIDAAPTAAWVVLPRWATAASRHG